MEITHYIEVIFVFDDCTELTEFYSTKWTMREAEKDLWKRDDVAKKVLNGNCVKEIYVKMVTKKELFPTI